MNILPRIKSLTTRMATEADQHIPAYDHTRLSNINMCPTWGVIRYGLHKRMPGSRRQLALEAGAAAHESFSAMRLFTLLKQSNRHLYDFHGVRLFGDNRFDEINDSIKSSATDVTNLINVASVALSTSGYYDDPDDRNRTLSNIEASLIYRCQQWDFNKHNIWIRDDHNESDVGIEIGFDVVVEIEYTINDALYTMTRRFIGKLDGLEIQKNRLTACEDKTGARLDDSWLAQWIMSHQITGYCIASSTFTNEVIMRAEVTGMKIPMARDVVGTIRREIVNRKKIMLDKWTEWFVHSALLFEQCLIDPLHAPQYTTSCNRYSNSCSFLPFCACDTEEEKEQALSDMETDEWNPLHE